MPTYFNPGSSEIVIGSTIFPPKTVIKTERAYNHPGLQKISENPSICSILNDVVINVAASSTVTHQLDNLAVAAVIHTDADVTLTFKPLGGSVESISNGEFSSYSKPNEVPDFWEYAGTPTVTEKVYKSSNVLFANRFNMVKIESAGPLIGIKQSNVLKQNTTYSYSIYVKSLSVPSITLDFAGTTVTINAAGPSYGQIVSGAVNFDFSTYISAAGDCEIALLSVAEVKGHQKLLLANETYVYPFCQFVDEIDITAGSVAANVQITEYNRWPLE